MTVRERKRRRRKTENLVRLTVVLMLLALLGSGGFVYAKYFSEGARYGVAIASGVYFTANYAAESEEYFESVVKYDYTGGAHDISFKVRNYENYLLFNESGVVIPYSISFWLGEAPVNATYSVVWQEQGEEKTQILQAGEGVTASNTITGQSIGGGSAFANEYIIKIVPSDMQEKHVSVPIYVQVETQEGAIVEKTLRGKMVLNSTSLIQNYIESQEFVVPVEIADDDSEKDAKKFAAIQEMSMLTYEVRTVGDVVTDEVTEKLKLSWNPNLLEIDLFDDAFMAWQESEWESSGIMPAKPAAETVDGETRYYIIMDVMPYSAQTINFFRGTGYNDETVNSLDDLENASTIWAEKYQVENEETE